MSTPAPTCTCNCNCNREGGEVERAKEGKREREGGKEDGRAGRMEISTPSLHILPPPSLAIIRREEEDEEENEKEKEGGSGNSAAVRVGAVKKQRLRLLASVQGVLRRFVGLEARLWLCSALQAVAVPDGVHAAVFMDLLRRAVPPASAGSHRSQRKGSDGEQAAKQVLRMMCESRPRQVARLLLNDSKMICRFFSGQTKRVLQWFQNFAIAGEMDHQLGARALARYAFTHREASWHELVWTGNHSQAPATVAAKPHYFAELDVQETIENFLDHVPSFWYSDELKESLEDGAFIALDVDFFVEELLTRMMAATDDESRVWQLLRSYVGQESFAVLCQRVLPIVDDESLLEVVNSLAAAMAKWRKRKSFGKTEREGRRGGLTGSTTTTTGDFWLEIVLSAGVKWKTLDDAIFCNACAGHGRRLFRLLLQEDDEQDAAKILESLLMGKDGYNDHDHWAVREQCLVFQKWEAVTWLALEAWLLFYLLSREMTSPAVLERLMTENGIGFLRTGGEKELEGEGTVNADRGKEENRSRKRKRWKSKKKMSKKKRGHIQNSDDSDSDTDLPFVAEQSSGGSGVSWRLSSDDYVITWTKMDVCEHLVNYALSRWLQWTVLRW